MKREAFNHPKMKLFGRLLGVPLYAANGLIARLWRFTSDHAPAGDIGRWDDWQIAEDLGWDDTRSSELIRALVKSGFVDESDHCRLIVHDWYDHCEDTVHTKLAKDITYFADGRQPKLTRYNQNERNEIESKYKQKPFTHAPVRKNAEPCEPARTSPLLAFTSPLLALPSLGVQGENAAVAARVVDEVGEDFSSPSEHPPVPAKPKKQKPLATMDAIPPNLNTEPFREAWGKWLKFRREKRRPFTEESQKTAFKHFEQMGITRAIAMIEHTIFMGWDGLREPEPQYQGRSPPGPRSGQAFDPTRPQKGFDD